MRLLIAEDDLAVGNALRQGLLEAGKKCVWTRNGLEALELARHKDFDAIILDVLLPGRNGMDVLRDLRAEGIKVPVLMVTALGTVEERVAGLSAGADDYLVKPFAFPELLARLAAVGRRVPSPTASILEAGDLKLDLESRVVSRGGVPVVLTPTEFSLFEFLMRHAGHVVTRKMICEHLWDADWEGATNIIDVHIKHLRAKLDSDPNASAIQTVRGRGYVLLARPGE